MNTEKYIANNSAFSGDDISIIINLFLIGLFTVISLSAFLTIKQKLNK